MGSEEGLGVPFVIVDIFDNRPSDGDTIVRAGTTSEFVEEHKASFGEVVEDRSRFVHLDHEGGFAEGDVIGRSNAGEDLIDDTDGCTLGRHERTHLCEEHDEGCLAEQGRFTRHVRTGDDDDLLSVIVQKDVVGDVLLSGWQLLLDDRMSSLTDVDDEAVVDVGTYIPMLGSYGGEGQEAVQLRQHIGV